MSSRINAPCSIPPSRIDELWLTGYGPIVQRRVHDFAAAIAAEVRAQPIDMVLHCPACGLQHIDKPEPELGPSKDGSGDMPLWSNPSHRSHLCHGCGHVWRPADVPTNGVKDL